MGYTAALRLIPVSGSGVEGQDFEISGLERWAGRWVRFRARVEVEGADSTWPRLYFDRGSGYSELQPFILPECSRSAPEIDYIFFVPRSLRTARVDAGAHRARFARGEARVTPLSSYAAAVAMLVPIAAADGFIAAARYAATALLNSVRNKRRAARAHPLIDRYRDLRMRRGNSYLEWIEAFEPSAETHQALSSARQAWPLQPKISVLVPVHDATQDELCEAIDSVLGQLYPSWELCFGGDGASALRVATGEFVALLQPGDRLHPLALHFVAEAIARHPDAGLIYTDEDRIDRQGRRHDPYFKCDFNYELLLAHNMIHQLGVYRRDLVESLDDYDLALRAAERLTADQIVHVPKVLYHCTAAANTASSAGAQEAVAAHLARRGIRARVMPAADAPGMNRVRFALPEPLPKVSIIIPTRDRADLLALCLDSIARRTTYRNYEIIIVDNGSRERATLELLQRQPAPGVRVIRDDSPFNFSALNNRAVRQAAGEFLCLMNNDIEVITPDWVEEMLSFAAQAGVGAVGARLWYPDGSLQHGGVILGLVSLADHANRFLRRNQTGYFGRAVLHQSFSAVTAACLMVRKSIYEQVHGLDENLPVAFNDIDFCLRLRQAGYRTVWTPYAEMIHHESASRARERMPEEDRRIATEVRLIEERWARLLLDDPAYSPNLTRERQDFSLAWPPRRP